MNTLTIEEYIKKKYLMDILIFIRYIFYNSLKVIQLNMTQLLR